MSVRLLLLLFNKIRSKRIEYPLKNINTIALRPSVAPEEILYSLPIAKALSKKNDLTVFLPEDSDFKYFSKFPIKIVEYPRFLSLLRIFRLRNRLKGQSFDLYIDLNRNRIDTFSFILNTPVTASIYEDTCVNLLARSSSISITRSYQYLMHLLGFSISWEEKQIGMKRWKHKYTRVGISSDIGMYPGFYGVSRPEDLYKISFLITKKNALSTIAFFLGIPQVLLLKEDDSFKPPLSIKVVRYSYSITGDIINKCLNA